MIELAEILRIHGSDYIDRYQEIIPQKHLKAINDILICRRKENGGQVYFCKHCQRFVYSYRSCGNRNCNKCQHELASKWLEKSKQHLLAVNHFLVTFTLPDSLRKLVRANQNLFYNLLFKCAAEALQSIAYDTKYAGGKLGMMAILHTWARNLIFHPHVHFIVTGGGFFEDEDIWLPSKEDFLVPVKALSMIFKGRFKDALKYKNITIFRRIDGSVWKNDWVVHSEPVGSGEQALSYLARYIFRPAISNNNILSLQNGVVTFKFKDTETNQWHIMKLSAEAFIHRYLQHVLPKGFVKVRYYGLYAQACKKKLQNIPINPLLKTTYKRGDKSKMSKTHICLKCQHPLILVEVFEKVCFYNNGPPKRNVLIEAIYKKLHHPDF